MTKFFLRFILYFLVPCLLTNPSLAHALMVDDLTVSEYSAQFAMQALAPTFVDASNFAQHHRHPYAASLLSGAVGRSADLSNGMPVILDGERGLLLRRAELGRDDQTANRSMAELGLPPYREFKAIVRNGIRGFSREILQKEWALYAQAVREIIESGDSARYKELVALSLRQDILHEILDNPDDEAWNPPVIITQDEEEVASLAVRFLRGEFQQTIVRKSYVTSLQKSLEVTLQLRGIARTRTGFYKLLYTNPEEPERTSFGLRIAASELIDAVGIGAHTRANLVPVEGRGTEVPFHEDLAARGVDWAFPLESMDFYESELGQFFEDFGVERVLSREEMEALSIPWESHDLPLAAAHANSLQALESLYLLMRQGIIRCDFKDPNNVLGRRETIEKGLAPLTFDDFYSFVKANDRAIVLFPFFAKNILTTEADEFDENRKQELINFKRDITLSLGSIYLEVPALTAWTADRNAGMRHVAVQVQNFVRSMARLKEFGVTLDEIKRVPLFGSATQALFLGIAFNDLLENAKRAAEQGLEDAAISYLREAQEWIVRSRLPESGILEMELEQVRHQVEKTLQLPPKEQVRPEPEWESLLAGWFERQLKDPLVLTVKKSGFRFLELSALFRITIRYMDRSPWKLNVQLEIRRQDILGYVENILLSLSGPVNIWKSIIGVNGIAIFDGVEPGGPYRINIVRSA